jgi:hypothetical protein
LAALGQLDSLLSALGDSDVEAGFVERLLAMLANPELDPLVSVAGFRVLCDFLSSPSSPSTPSGPSFRSFGSYEPGAARESSGDRSCLCFFCLLFVLCSFCPCVPLSFCSFAFLFLFLFLFVSLFVFVCVLSSFFPFSFSRSLRNLQSNFLHFNSESVSNEIDESELQYERKYEERI